MSESNRSVEVIAPSDVPAFVNSPVDLLRSDASLNLQARGPEGVQADLSIRGTTFEQSLVDLMSRPTINIEGIYGGYTGPGGKTVLPTKASVKRPSG